MKISIFIRIIYIIRFLMTKYHSKYYANFLSLQQPSRGVQRLWSSLLNATIDLNPHQIDWALFFFDNPLNKWIMLADEVWLGKTIEAWLILCQLRSERKRKILLVVPASLRKQWVAELQEKFHIPAKIMDWPIYRKMVDNDDATNPFNQDAIIVTSYSFAWSENNEKYNTWDHIENIKRDLVVFDEAHKLRNIYKDLDSDLEDFIGKDKEEAQRKRSTAKKLFDRFENTKKLLLTATPLQNSLLELFWLMNFVDPYSFADLDSFKEQYNPQIVTQSDLNILRNRIQPYFHRTLRKQVAWDIKYTQRKPLTQEYQWSFEEETFYEQVSEFLRTSKIFQNKNGQVNYLVILIYRKLLASSVPAVLGTLKWLCKRIEKEIEEIKKKTRKEWKSKVIIDDEDIVDIYKEETEEKDFSMWNILDENIDEGTILKLEWDLKEIQKIIELWEKINDDNKADALLQAIHTAYQQLDELGARKKVLIFTESRRTQDYLHSFLENNGYGWKIVCFNGDNNSPIVRKIYNDWKAEYEHTAYFSWSLTSDTRASIVDYFKSTAEIMIATESASEWVNLQFCSLVINYDLPWNPQRVEQRIGRSHRYWQEFDVIVINIINTKNRADQRVFELLNQKFSLFQWLFGASDTVLWALESGIDIEKTILEIYQTCRTKEEIDQAFDKLQEDMSTIVASRMEETKEKVLNRLDEDVARRLKDKKQESELLLSMMQERLMKLVKFECRKYIQDIWIHAFQLSKSPKSNITTWIYSFDTKKTAGYLLRSSDSLGQYCIEKALSREIQEWGIVFNLSKHETKISVLENLKWKSWYLMISKLIINAYATEEYLVHSWVIDSWEIIDEEIVEKMMSLFGDEFYAIISNDIKDKLQSIEKWLIEDIKVTSRDINQEYFVMEMDKLDHWADDLKVSLEKQRKAIKTEIGNLKKEYRSAQQLEEKVELQRKIRNLEQKESKLRREINELEDQIDKKKEVLIDEIEKRLDAQSNIEELFTIRWEII